MTVGHNNFLPLKIQPSEEMTMSQYFFTAENPGEIFTAENSAKRGDDMVR